MKIIYNDGTERECDGIEFTENSQSAHLLVNGEVEITAETSLFDRIEH